MERKNSVRSVRGVIFGRIGQRFFSRSWEIFAESNPIPAPLRLAPRVTNIMADGHFVFPRHYVTNRVAKLLSSHRSPAALVAELHIGRETIQDRQLIALTSCQCFTSKQGEAIRFEQQVIHFGLLVCR